MKSHSIISVTEKLICLQHEVQDSRMRCICLLFSIHRAVCVRDMKRSSYRRLVLPIHILLLVSTRIFPAKMKSASSCKCSRRMVAYRADTVSFIDANIDAWQRLGETNNINFLLNARIGSCERIISIWIFYRLKCPYLLLASSRCATLHSHIRTYHYMIESIII